MKDVERADNIVSPGLDPQYEKVAFLFSDPLSTAVVERGLASRGLSTQRARSLVTNERRMREATRHQGKFLAATGHRH